MVTDGSPRTEAEEPLRWTPNEGKRPGEEGLLLSGRPYMLREFERFSARLRTIRAADKVGRSGAEGALSLHRRPSALSHGVRVSPGRRSARTAVRRSALPCGKEPAWAGSRCL